MNKYVVTYSDDVQDALKFRQGTLIFLRGKSGSCINQVFSAVDIGIWIDELKLKHTDHPVITDLKKLVGWMKRNKLDLILW